MLQAAKPVEDLPHLVVGSSQKTLTTTRTAVNRPES